MLHACRVYSLSHGYDRVIAIPTNLAYYLLAQRERAPRAYKPKNKTEVVQILTALNDLRIRARRGERVFDY